MHIGGTTHDEPAGDDGDRVAFREEEVQLMFVGGLFGAVAGLVQFLAMTGLPRAILG